MRHILADQHGVALALNALEDYIRKKQFDMMCSVIVSQMQNRGQQKLYVELEILGSPHSDPNYPIYLPGQFITLPIVEFTVV